ncbi:hypothetical protein Tco_0016405 [Tanacetum coccineum]
MVISSPCLTDIKKAFGKDFSNPFTADSFLKTIWFSTHHASRAPCYSNEALAIPEQTATGKEISNPFMAGEDCWVLEDFTTYCCWFNIGAASEDLVLLRKIEENRLTDILFYFFFPQNAVTMTESQDLSWAPIYVRMYNLKLPSRSAQTPDWIHLEISELSSDHPSYSSDPGTAKLYVQNTLSEGMSLSKSIQCLSGSSIMLQDAASISSSNRGMSAELGRSFREHHIEEVKEEYICGIESKVSNNGEEEQVEISVTEGSRKHHEDEPSSKQSQCA